MQAKKSLKLPFGHDKNVTLAVAQMGSVLGDNRSTLATMQNMAKQAADAHAQLIVFPEALLGGYPKGMDFGASVGIRTAEGRKIFQQYASCAVTIGDDTWFALVKIAIKHKLHLLTGFVEQDGGTLYCSTVLLSPEGEILNVRRKLMPTAQERVIWGQGDGKGLEVLETPIGRIGAAICWENYMPLLRMALYQQQIQLYCIPTVDDREAWQPTLRHIAREGRCFVISACQYMEHANYPVEWLQSANNLPMTAIRGGSCIINPMGEYVIPPLYDKEDLLFAKIDVGEITAGKFDLDVAGHYNRPDIFSFSWGVTGR